jgi:colicin import membrane protein
VNFGLIISVLLHVAILACTLFAFHSQRRLHAPQTEPVAVGMIAPGELTKVRRGVETAKLAETEAKVSSEGREARKEAAKATPATAAPPPRRPSAPPLSKAEARSDPVAEKLRARPPQPPPARPPDPDGQKPSDAAQKKQKPAEQQKRTAAQRRQEQRRQAEQKRKEQRREDERKRREAAAAAKSKFDADRIAALLSKVPNASKPPPSAPPDRPTKAKGPALGAPDGQDKQLSASEKAMIGQIIRSCVIPNWTVLSGGASAQETTVKVRLRFNADGTFSAPPTLMNAQGGAYYQAISESALRAVHQCEPYNLPPDKYEFWKDVVMNFSPRDMF